LRDSMGLSLCMSMNWGNYGNVLFCLVLILSFSNTHNVLFWFFGLF
jgi:hypothetical protein